jgi:hypothetical protein
MDDDGYFYLVDQEGLSFPAFNIYPQMIGRRS